MGVFFNSLGGLPKAYIYTAAPDSIYNEERFMSVAVPVGPVIVNSSINFYGYTQNVQPTQQTPAVNGTNRRYAWNLGGASNGNFLLPQYLNYEDLFQFEVNGSQYTKAIAVNLQGANFNDVIVGKTQGTATGGLIRSNAIADRITHLSNGQNAELNDVYFTAGRQFLITGDTRRNNTSKIFWARTNVNFFSGDCEGRERILLFRPALTAGFISYGLPLASDLNQETGEANTLKTSPVQVTISTPCGEEKICAEEPCKTGWIRRFGFSQPIMPEGLTATTALPDGTLAMAGFRRDSLVLINATAEGDVLWLRTIRTGRNNRADELLTDSDGNWVIAGYNIANNTTNAFLLKYSPLAEVILWYKQSTTISEAEAIEEKMPGGNYVAQFSTRVPLPNGSSRTTSILLEFDRNTGDIIANGMNWASAGNFYATISNIRQHKGRIWAGGQISDTLATLFRLNNTGVPDLRWRIQGGINDLLIRDFVFHQDSIIVLTDNNNPGFADFQIIKIAPDGKVIFTQNYYILQPNATQVNYRQIELLPDGGFLIMGNYGNNSGSEIITARYSVRGNLIWAKNLQNDRALNFYGRKHLISSGTSTYLAAENIGASDRNFWFTRFNTRIGSIGASDCGRMSSIGLLRTDVEFSVLNAEIPSTTAALTFSTLPVSSQNSVAGISDYLCRTPCQEICDNNLSEDYDDAFDCFDTDCDCGDGCAGERSNIWYFGKNAGLDFSTDPPTILTDGKTQSRGPTAVQSTHNGKMVFYYDSTIVYDRFHNPMPGNNSGLSQATGYGVASWRSGDPTLYALIHAGKSLISGSIIDMAGRRYFGNVETNNANPVAGVKFAVDAEKGHIIVKSTDANTWNAYTYYISGTLGNLIKSQAGTTNAGGINDAGQIKFSQDGRYLANTLPGTGGFDLLPFDCENGILSNGISVILPELKDAFGLEFSPDDRYLYISTYGSPSRVWQFDVSDPTDAAKVAGSRVLLAQSNVPKTFAYLQLARNGKIYVAMNPNDSGSNALSVINAPNEKGVTCLFQERGQSLGTGRCYFGLPQFVQEDIGFPPPIRLMAPDSVCGTPAKIELQIRGINCNDQATLSVGTGAFQLVTGLSQARNLENRKRLQVVFNKLFKGTTSPFR